MKKTRVAINGFGRIGRTVFRLLLNHPDIEVVAINDLVNSKTLSHLLKYDSIHGVLGAAVDYGASIITVDGKAFPVLNERRIEEIRWQPFDVDIVIETTGRHKTRTLLHHHLGNGAKKVILSVPPEDNTIKTVVLGVNEDILNDEDVIVSNASCTTNNAAPMIKIINRLCGIEQAYITTVHSYTTDQSLHDQPHRDLRRARAAGLSIIPTTTGAAKALTRIFPELSSVMGGCGLRVPVPNGSLTDITFNVKKKTSIAEVNHAFKTAAENELTGILSYTEDPIVSVDIVNNPHSCVFDAQMTSVIGKMVKIIGWYDNEYGYGKRMVELIGKLTAV